MKVKLLEGRCVNDYPFTQAAGEVIEVPDSEGRSLIEAGSAEPVVVKRAQARETR